MTVLDPSDRHIVFPPPENAEEDGLLAIGGTLDANTIIRAYKKGIFPWFIVRGMPYWFSPDPRCVLFPDALHISHSMRPLLHKRHFSLSFDTCFDAVIEHCAATPRNTENGTWISRDFIRAYGELHRKGLAHSVEVWDGGMLAGGLYGVSLGSCFFGESMFSEVPNASKFGLICLVEKLRRAGFSLIDCQVHTAHLARLGAQDIPRSRFLRLLKDALSRPTLTGNWSFLAEPGGVQQEILF